MARGSATSARPIAPEGLAKIEIRAPAEHFKAQNNKSKSYLTLLVLAALLVSLPAAAPAQAAETPIAVRTGLHQDFNRLVFDWPKNIDYTLAQNGSEVTLTFNSSAPIALAKAQNLPLIGKLSLEQKDNRSIVRFTLPANSRVQHFRNGTFIVIDVRPEKQNAKEKEPEKKAAEKPPAAAAPVITAPAAAPITTATTTTTSTTASAASVASSVAESATPAAESATTSVAESASPSVAGSATAKISLPNNSSPQTSQQGPANAEPTSATPTNPAPQIKTESANSPATTSLATTTPALLSEASKTRALYDFTLTTEPLLVATLNPTVPTALAAFIRGDYGYVVFDRRLALSDDTLIAAGSRVLLERVASNNSSIYRFAVPVNARLSVNKSGTSWRLFLSVPSPSIPVSLSITPQPDFSLGARLVLEAARPAPVQAFNDDIVGDQLWVVPLPEPNQAVGEAVLFTDLRFVPSAQGIVIQPFDEGLAVRPLTDGIEITKAGGLQLSPAGQTGITSAGKKNTNSVLDVANWQLGGTEEYAFHLQRLQQTIIEVGDLERDRARLDLARFYLAHNHALEALGVTSVVLQNVPDIADRPEFLVLVGAANILAGRLETGIEQLTKSGLLDQPDVRLWRAIAATKQRDWSLASGLFAQVETGLAQLPEPFYTEFNLMAIEAAVADEDSELTNRLLDNMAAQKGEKIFEMPAVQYLRGVIEAKKKNYETARNFWKKALVGNDRLFRVRAELALTDLAVGLSEMTPILAAERLEGLRYAWRGDDLEIEILRRLAAFYLQAGAVADALYTLDYGARHFPGTPLAESLRAQMRDTFKQAFVGELGQRIPPLDAFALYEKFQRLIPSGPDGEAIIRNLAERLVAIDLLDRAAALLQNQVDQRLKGEEKTQTATRLAAIYLLNRQPQKSLAILDSTDAQVADIATTDERQLLRGRALSDVGRNSEALALLAGRSDEAASRLKADIAWRARDWTAAAQFLQDVMGTPPATGEKLPADKSQAALNRAVALALIGDVAALELLRRDFEPSMVGSPQFDAFRLLTSPDRINGPMDLRAIQSRANEVDLFKGFLDNYRQTQKPVLPKAN